MSIIRDLSLILLAAEAFVIALVPLVVFGALVYGMWQLLKHENAPRWLSIVRAYIELGRAYITRAMALVVQPVFWISSTVAKIEAWMKVIARAGGN